MKKVAYIVKVTKNETFRLFMADVIKIEEDNDSLLNVTMTGPKFDSLEEAQKTLKVDHDTMLFKGITPYYNPVKSNGSGMTWLSELINANES